MNAELKIHSFQYFLHPLFFFLFFLNLNHLNHFISFYFYFFAFLFSYLLFSLSLFNFMLHYTSFLFSFFLFFLLSSLSFHPLFVPAKITTRFLLPLSFVSREQRVRSSLGGHNFLLIIKERPRRNMEVGGVGIATDAITVSYGN